MTNNVSHKLADAIESNGGYYSRPNRWPLSWDVSVWSSRTTEDMARLHIKEARVKDRVAAAVALVTSESDNLSGRYAELGVELFDLDQAGEFAIEDMRCGLDEYDTYRYVAPEVYEKYGLPGDTMFDVKFELHGRGGKHLCITEFEGRKLAGIDAEDLRDAEYQEEVGVSDDWCRKLLAYIEEADKMFSRESVRTEFEAQVQFQFQLAVEAALEAMDAEDKRLVDVDLAYAGLFLEKI